MNNPTPVTPAANAPDAKTLFRLYRQVPLDQVMTALRAEKQGETYIVGVQRYTIDPTQQAWRQEGATDAEGKPVQGKGAIDLVAQVQRSTPGRALMFLKQHFPGFTPPAHTPSASRPASNRFGDSWTKAELDALFERYKTIRLDAVIEALDGHLLEDGKCEFESVGKIIYKHQMWMNAYTGIDKGFGGPSLAAHVLSLPNQVQGLKWMISKFGQEFGDDLVVDIEKLKQEKKEFEAPERFEGDNHEALSYLHGERGLPKALLQDLMDRGDLYITHPYIEEDDRYLTNIHRCVFLGPASAELRDTTKDGFKGCAPGSETDYSGFSVPQREEETVSEDIVAITEAAIDAMSYHALFPGRFVLSSNGSGRFLLMYRLALEAYENELGIHLATDADGAGDQAAQKIFNAFYLRKSLSKQLGVTEETVDEWLLRGDIALSVQQSPHHLVFSQPDFVAELPVHAPFRPGSAKETLSEDELAEVLNEQPEHSPRAGRIQWLPTGESKPPVIEVRVIRDVHPKLQRGTLTLPITEAGFKYVTTKMRLRRDRPQWTKDWNDDLRRLGRSYIVKYDRAHADGFRHGAPELPPPYNTWRTNTFSSPATPEPEPVVAPVAREQILAPSSASSPEVPPPVSPTASQRLRPPGLHSASSMPQQAVTGRPRLNTVKP